jgi:hypothetical protein
MIRLAGMKLPQKVTVEWCVSEVDAIRTISGDNEAAHTREDDLHKAVLKAIAEGNCDDAAGCAAAVLKTLDIDFARWCA